MGAMGSLPETFTGPGLVDLQLNGYAGFDFNGDPASWSADDLHRLRETFACRGVLRVFPTFVTDAADRLLARARRYGELVDADAALAECFPRVHVEGPFISPEEGPRGAHPAAHCSTPEDLPDLLDEMLDAAGGRVGIWTIAPEVPGAIAWIERAAAAGVCVAIGHTGADAEALDRAVAAGATLSTHLGNGSHQLLPRLDNYLETQLADDRLAAGFIADGHHIPFPTLKNFLRAKGVGRSVLVTDAMSAAEMPPGRYDLGRRVVEVSPEGVVRQPGSWHLAGSSVTLDRCVVNACLRADVSFEDAWAMASAVPGRVTNLPACEPVTVRVREDGFAAREE